METPDPKYKHKPSEKHTLEEVLKSLQDLIRNDLAENTAGAGKPESSSTPEPGLPREKLPRAREDFAPVSPGSGPVNLDAVMRSLKDLIGNELNVGEESGPDPDKSAATHDEFLTADEKIEEYIPEGLDQFDDELIVGEEPAVDEPVSEVSHDEQSPPEEIVEESLPQEFTLLDESLTLESAPETILTSATPSAAAGRSEEISLELDQNLEESASEDFTPLDEELTFESSLETAPAPAASPETLEFPGEISPELDQVNEEPAPEEFTPLDEELTFEAPLESEPPPPAALAESTDLPGEITPEMLETPEPATPAVVTTSPVTEEDIAPGTQRDLFLDGALSSTPEPEAVTADSAPVMAPEPPTPGGKREQPLEAKPESQSEALPTIDVEESFDDNEYFAAPSGEAQPTTSDSSVETIALDAEIAAEPEIVAPTVAEAAAPPLPPETKMAPASPATPVEPAGEKIILETAIEPARKKPRDEYSVDFDSSGLSPPLPEESELAPPETNTATESQTLSEAAKAESAPTPASEVVAPPPEPPAVETKTETAAEKEPSPQATEAATPETPAPSNLDDIPVLNEVVAPPAKRLRKTKPVPASPKTPLPAPDRAREIVVRAVAKLNVEMRKTGSAGLDTKTILRLQQLIRQELEKGGEK